MRKFLTLESDLEDVENTEDPNEFLGVSSRRQCRHSRKSLETILSKPGSLCLSISPIYEGKSK